MLAPADIVRAAAALDRAEASRAQIGLLSQRDPQMTIDDAYAVQDAWMATKYQRGSRRIGWKIGLTSRAMQAALNIHTPDSGVLLDDMLFADGDAIPADRFIQPRIEAELAFVLKSDLAGDHISVTDVLNATDYVTPALEILDTRIVRVDPQTGKARTIVDTIADNAANAGVAPGGRAMRPDSIDLRWVGAIVARNGVVEETGLAAGVLNHPARGVAWLASQLTRRSQHLVAGDLVLSGSFIRPLETRPGDVITADFGPMGSVSVHFAPASVAGGQD